MSQYRNSVIVYNNITTANELLTESNPCNEVSKTKITENSNPMSKKVISISNDIINQNIDQPKDGRKDVLGNAIIKGTKNYKVTFRDKTSNEPLTEELTVKSYKRYYNNTENDYVEQKVKVTCCYCKCIIM
jgi:hypothetical protein